MPLPAAMLGRRVSGLRTLGGFLRVVGVVAVPVPVLEVLEILRGNIPIG